MANSIGALNERITFQAYTSYPDGIGGETREWADIATNPTVWARVMPKSGREDRAEDRVTATAMTVFQIRYRSDIDETMRIAWEGEYYNIRNVPRKSQRNHYLEIEAERGVQTA